MHSPHQCEFLLEVKRQPLPFYTVDQVHYIHSKTSAGVKYVHNHLLHYTESILSCNFHVNNSILSVLVLHLTLPPLLLWSDPQRSLNYWLSKKRKAIHKYLSISWLKDTRNRINLLKLSNRVWKITIFPTSSYVILVAWLWRT